MISYLTSVNWSLSNNTADMVLKWVLKTRSDKYKHWHLIEAVVTLIELTALILMHVKKEKYRSLLKCSK